MITTPLKKSALFTLFLVVVVDLIGFGIVIPILPYYAKAYGASATELGLLMMTYSLMQFLIAPMWGSLSDRIGRRPVLLASMLGTIASLIVIARAPTFTWLVIGRTLAGVFGANISTAYAYVTDITTNENRAKGMGLVGAGFGIGFIIGPAIGGVLSPYGYAVPMWFAAALATVNWVFAFFSLAEPLTSSEQRAQNRIRRFSLDAWSRAFTKPETRFPITLFFFLTWAATQMEVAFGIFLLDRFSWDARRAGLLLAFMGFMMALVQGGLIGRLVKRFGESRLIPVGAALSAVALVTFGASTTAVGVYVALITLAFGNGVMQPSLSSWVSKGAGDTERGAVMGVYQSAGSFARVVGPLTAGALYDRLSPSAPFYAGAALLVGIFFVTLRPSPASAPLAAGR